MDEQDSATEVEQVLGELDGVVSSPETGRAAGDILVCALDTALGSMVLGVAEDRLAFLEFTDAQSVAGRLESLRQTLHGRMRTGESALAHRVRQEISEYLSGGRRQFNIPLRLAGTPFQVSVWDALQEIPYGSTESYSSLADRLGCPDAVRAVARANASNRLAIIVPCPRVIGRNGKLTGYAGGLNRKRHLLDLEAASVGRPVQSRLF
jgi:AraC family transcriptional regulator of adaptative response/methylated-DNA-[protein]-cysteine methyltransferase